MNTGIDFSPASPSIESQQNYGECEFPLVFSNETNADREATFRWVGENRAKLKSLATAHGAILLRNFGVGSAEDFDRMIELLDVANFPYKKSLSNAVRVNYTERVFSANEAPPQVKIFLHHEMAQTPLFPTRILFFCEQAAEQGGATPICRSDVLFERVRMEVPQFINSLARYGLKYSNVMPADDDRNSGMGRSWRSTLGVDSKEQAQSRLRELGYAYTWLAGDCLRATTPTLPAIRQLADGRCTLFNQLIAAYSGWSDDRNDPSDAIRLGNEQKLDAEGVGQLCQIADELTFEVAWQDGDVAFLDNTVAMHGRRPFMGKRRVLASLADMETHSFDA